MQGLPLKFETGSMVVPAVSASLLVSVLSEVYPDALPIVMGMVMCLKGTRRMSAPPETPEPGMTTARL